MSQHNLQQLLEKIDLDAIVTEELAKHVDVPTSGKSVPATKPQLKEAYAPQPKPYSLSTEALGEDTKTAHLELYRGYVEQLAKISAQLDAVERKGIDSNTSEYRSLKYDELFHLNAVHLHELYFANISDVHSEIRHDSLAYMRLGRDWGTFDEWQFDFKAACESAGNGWAMCVYSTFLQRFINVFITSHVTNIPAGCYPVIVMDMHEHAYYSDYKNNKRGYIIKMMQELNWDVIEERIKRADLIQKALEA